MEQLLLQVEHSAILLTFIKPPIVIKIIVLSIFEWPFYTGFTVLYNTVEIVNMYLNVLNYFKQDQTLLWTCVAGANRQCVNSRYAKFK